MEIAATLLQAAMQSPPTLREARTVPPAPVPQFGAASRELFGERYNRASFLFAHSLHLNPLFLLPSLVELARRLPPQPASAYWANGRVGVNQRWDAKVAPRRALLDTVEHIEENDSLVMLKHLEADSIFGPLIREICDRVIELVGPEMRDDVLVARGTLLIASPGRLTPYHLDSDVNYLFQISGDKWFRVFDQKDRTLTTHEELERYYNGDLNGAVFKEARQRDAHLYDLRPGFGVHVPSMAPHWAENREHFSVALSINFDLRSITRLGRIYCVNCKLRNRGLHPRPPGLSAWRDTLKLGALTGLHATHRIMNRVVHGPRSQNG